MTTIRRLIQASNLIKSDSIHFHDVQWSTMLISEMNLVIYALVSAHEISKFEVWNVVALQSKIPCGPLDLNSNLNMSDLITSNVDLFMFLIEGIRIGTWKVRRLNWALNV